jgi:ASC-1-like (ASCH) protein
MGRKRLKEELKCEPLKKLLPDADTIKQGVEIYKRFYTEQQQQEFGVVAVEVERVMQVGY